MFECNIHDIFYVSKIILLENKHCRQIRRQIFPHMFSHFSNYYIYNSDQRHRCTYSCVPWRYHW